MSNDNIKSTVILSLFWKLMERSAVQGIQFIIQLILARLLLPNDYGIIALISIFITIANVFIQSGFNTALIQKKDADEIDFSSVFYLSFFVASILYVIIFFIAPIIAAFYRVNQLTLILRVISITLFFNVFNSIQTVVISKNMQFRKLFLSSLGSSMISGFVGIIFAYGGFGAWALVAQQLANQLIIAVILWFTVKWRPILIFSLCRIKGLFSFGWKLLISALIDTLYINLRSLIIFKIYNPAMLGFYNRGDQFPQILVTNINGAIQSVMLPALASEQDNITRVKEMVRRSIIISSFILFPIMIGLAVIAEPIVIILLTDKWLPCVPFLQIMCIAYVFWPIHTANLQAINALGRSDIFLKLEIIKKSIGIIILYFSIPFGIYIMAAMQPLVSLFASIINSYPNRKLLDYGYKEQFMDVMPSMILSVIMGILVYTIRFLDLSVWLTLIIQIIFGLFIYVTLAYLFKLECFTYLLNTIREIKNKKI